MRTSETGSRYVVPGLGPRSVRTVMVEYCQSPSTAHELSDWRDENMCDDEATTTEKVFCIN